MIRTISLRNYQAHKRTVLRDLSPGVNIIVGPSDSGKTSVIRALKWIWSNRPIGNGMIRHGQDFARASITLEDGTKIIRQRGKANQYKIINAHGKDDSFVAVNTGVPEEVEKALELRPINFQFQLDAPYMLGLSPGEAAKMLNEVAGLADIDRVLGNFGQMKRRNDSALREAVQNLEEAKERLAKYPSTETMDSIAASISHVEKLSKEMNELQYDKEELEQIQEQIKRQKTRIAKLEKWKSIEKEVDVIDEQQQERDILALKCTALNKRAKAFDNLQSSIKLQKAELIEMEKEWKIKMPKQCPLCGGRTK